jgi:hypothetical protein
LPFEHLIVSGICTRSTIKGFWLKAEVNAADFFDTIDSGFIELESFLLNVLGQSSISGVIPDFTVSVNCVIAAISAAFQRSTGT